MIWKKAARAAALLLAATYLDVAILIGLGMLWHGGELLMPGAGWILSGAVLIVLALLTGRRAPGG